MYISSDESNDALNDVFSDYEEDVNENVDDESDINSVCEEEDADDEERRNFSIYLLQFFLENGISNVKSDQFLKKLYTFDFIKKLKLNKSTKALSNYVKKKIRYNPPIGEYVSVKSTIENIIKKDILVFDDNIPNKQYDDIYSSTNFQEINKMDKNKHYYHLCIELSFDGVEVMPFSTNKQSVDILSFKIISSINNYRLINLINVSYKYESIDNILKLLVEELNYLFRIGININNKWYNVYLVNIIGDMPAIIKLLHFHNYVSSSNYCRYCTAESKLVNGKQCRKIYGRRFTDFTTISYQNFLIEYNRKRGLINSYNNFINLDYYSLKLVGFDTMHTLNNGIKPMLKYILTNRLCIMYVEENFKFIYSINSSSYKNINIYDINRYNLLQQNYLMLNILPILIMNSENQLCKSVFSIINVINNVINYDWCGTSVEELKQTLVTNMNIIEKYVHFTPSVHMLYHIVDYLQYTGSLAHNSIALFERSYGIVKRISLSNRYLKQAVFNTINKINQLYIYNYKDNTVNTYNIISNISDNIKNIFQSINLKSYFLVSYICDKKIMIGIIRNTTKNSDVIEINRIKVQLINDRIYKYLEICKETLFIKKNNINIFVNMYYDNHEYYFFITDFIKVIH